MRPSHALLEAASKVAMRERGSSEVDAMFDCFLQLRVTPPDDFPISDTKQKHREERLKIRAERQRKAEKAWAEGVKLKKRIEKSEKVSGLFAPGVQC